MSTDHKIDLPALISAYQDQLETLRAENDTAEFEGALDIAELPMRLVEHELLLAKSTASTISGQDAIQFEEMLRYGLAGLQRLAN